MIRKILPSIFALCVAQAASAIELDKPLPMDIGGRVATDTQNGQTRYTYSWPGIYFAAEFTGTQVEARFDDDQNFLALIVDNMSPILITKPGKASFKLTDLTPGKHSIRLEKLTETQGQVGSFGGFYIAQGDQAEPVKKYSRSIEFIGDSFTVGYGNISKTRDCTTEDVFATTDNSRAFGPLTAKHFGAAYQINAWSGFGIVRNYNGHAPDKSLLKIYPFTTVEAGKDQLSRYENPAWQPQIIVIGLGTNDFSTPLNPEERWKTREELRADYVANYVNFVRDLQKKNPKAFFILMASDGANGEIAQQVGLVVEKLKKQKVTRVDSIIFKGLEFTGCNWHPSTKDDQTLSKLLVDYIEAKKDLW